LACVDQGKDAENKSLLKRFFKIDLLLWYYDLISRNFMRIHATISRGLNLEHKIQIAYDQIIIKKILN